MEVKGQLINSSSYSSSEALQRELCPRIRLERVQELLEKQKSLQQVLSLRLKELRRVCLQEAELTGKLPPEYPLEPGERLWPVRRRTIVASRIAPVLKNEENPSLEELSQELALQQQVAEAARRLAVAPDLTVDQRRRRRQVQADAAQRLRELEVQVAECRVRLGKGPLQRAAPEEAFHSESSSLSESASHENDDPRSFHPSKVSSHPGAFPDRSSPPKARDHLRAISSSPDRRPGWRILQPDVYSEAKDRRNSVASPTSPNRTLPRSMSSFEGRSVPATPVLARNACSGNHQLRSEAPSLHSRQWSGSHDSQLGPPSRDTSADRASLFAARTRRSNSSEALIERAPSEDPLLPTAPPFKSAEALTPCLSGRTPRPPYNDLLLDYYLERRSCGGGEHLSRRDGPPHLEWGAFSESPLQRRARPAARTKSCGPLLPPQSREVGYGPPLLPPRNFHKALALEGLRDWYLRNAGVTQRGAPERRGPSQSVQQHLRGYCDPGPSNPDVGYYGGPVIGGGLPHSVSYAGQPLYGRYAARFFPLP
ncbi:coiled-coil domain-containing protein 120 [Pseudonaja textilis]|uniref:coiled-coil domain-containing protein 120 n=1 Tax=Pseudonaja textilis TaxID=8673 RepID=UPI000EA98742|nr:coiled-coil domain-containing protein 120 [Pseudonaja textilis]XP_026567460.1 coiled-coil domain-containing protein 120 [Pseudonaja textilis]XP_026567461.1 coiled-coil domain-containing protein 120 [Pseudonaja textilis]XP_026567462.1 coiled-coil domain-containing protein 120 [Pseudonaja textilis]XP_026567463.1 coiled-coil domain-containing protein 120 [Pseudonaja textilis]XP_026567464.1 coiled-coil domain-containing protein 120 [Pseudonaja textilis]XP_026567465.1 coiled-coil domain-contain